MWLFIKMTSMKTWILFILLFILSLATSAQGNQPKSQTPPVFPERVDRSTLQRDSLERAPQTSPSNAEIIAEPAGEQPALQLQRDSVIRERKSKRTEKE